MPLSIWYRQEPVRDFVKDILLSVKAQNRGFIDTKRIESLLDNERDYGRGLWGLLNLELWMQTSLDGQFELH